MQIIKAIIQKIDGIKKMDICDSGKYGFAVDIGTTTIVVALVEMSENKVVDQISQKNQQTQYGSDVMMRLMHCRQGRQEILHQMLIEQLGHMMLDLISRQIKSFCVERIVIAGNTTMCHLLLNRDTEGLCGSPFQADYQGIVQVLSSKLGLPEQLQCPVLVCPGVAAHVGGDAVAAGVELGLGDKDNVFMVDIGTNTEMILSQKGQWMVCSAPAGPAFEGMEIHQGMRGEPGAIVGYRIAIQTENLLIEYLADPSGKKQLPTGICGSGLIALIAELVRCGAIRSDGHLLHPEEAAEQKIPLFLADRLIEYKDTKGNKEIGFIAYQEDRHPEHRVLLLQEDIRQFQLAKASVQAGLKVLLLKHGLTLNQISQIQVAGVFGSALSIPYSERVGLLPRFDKDNAQSEACIQMAGNAALRGASKALCDKQWLNLMLQKATSAEHIELAADDSFQSLYMQAMELTPWQ